MEQWRSPGEQGGGSREYEGARGSNKGVLREQGKVRGLSHPRAENGPLLACQDCKVLALFFCLLELNNTIWPVFDMELRRSGRTKVPRTI
jgi:hypothetical protein